MRNLLWVFLASSAVFAIGSGCAVAKDDAYCIRGCDYGSGVGDCSFSSYQQCQATASGRLAYCAANPYFSRSADLQSHRSAGRRRKP